ncbi:MAG: hypothetical protein ACRD2L_06490, partial [Terriglobia bacterium]
FKLTGDKVGFDAAMTSLSKAVAAQLEPEVGRLLDVKIITTRDPSHDTEIQKVSKAAARLIAENHLDLSLFAGMEVVTAPDVRAMMDKMAKAEVENSPEPEEPAAEEEAKRWPWQS